VLGTSDMHPWTPCLMCHMYALQLIAATRPRATAFQRHGLYAQTHVHNRKAAGLPLPMLMPAASLSAHRQLIMWF